MAAEPWRLARHGIFAAALQRHERDDALRISSGRQRARADAAPRFRAK